MKDLMTKSFTGYVDLKKSPIKDVDLEAGLPPNDVELSSSTTNMDTGMGPFLEEAEKVKTEIGHLQEILNRFQQEKEESKSLIRTEALKSLRNRINADIVTVLKTARTIRPQLEEMDRDNAANRRLSGLKDGTPSDLQDPNSRHQRTPKESEGDHEGVPGLRQRMMTEYRDTVEDDITQ